MILFIPPEYLFRGLCLRPQDFLKYNLRALGYTTHSYELMDPISTHTELHEHRTIPSDTQRSDHERFLTCVEPKHGGSLTSPPWRSGQRTTNTTQLGRPSIDGFMRCLLDVFVSLFNIQSLLNTCISIRASY